MASNSHSFVKYCLDLIKQLIIVPNLQLGDKNGQVLSTAAGDEEEEINKMEVKKGKKKEKKIY